MEELLNEIEHTRLTQEDTDQPTQTLNHQTEAEEDTWSGTQDSIEHTPTQGGSCPASPPSDDQQTYPPHRDYNHYYPHGTRHEPTTHTELETTPSDDDNQPLQQAPRVTLSPWTVFSGPSNRHQTPAQRLQITEEELANRIIREIDDVLIQHRNERQWARLIPGDDNLQRILNKEDCLTLFRAYGYPTSGPLMGIYRWAADLGWAQYNYEADFTPENIAALGEYD